MNALVVNDPDLQAYHAAIRMGVRPRRKMGARTYLCSEVTVPETYWKSRGAPRTRGVKRCARGITVNPGSRRVRVIFDGGSTAEYMVNGKYFYAYDRAGNRIDDLVAAILE